MKMNKLFATVVLGALTLAANAATTATAFITVSSTSGGNDLLVLMEAADGTDAYENGKDVKKLKNPASSTSINFYAVNNDGIQLSTVYTNSLEDLTFVLEANTVDDDYTLTFSNVTGTVKIKDPVSGDVVTLTNGGSHVIHAGKGQTVTGKLNPSVVVPQFCFVNEVLTVNGYAGKKLAILKADKSVLVAEFTLADTYEFDFSGAAYPAKSKYIIMFDGLSTESPAVMKEYVIDVKPEVTKVNP